MKKIGILTIQHSANYGACLQCYALWKYLTDEGYDAEVIDLHRPHGHADYVPSKRFRRTREIKRSFLGKIKFFVKGILGIKEPFKSLFSEEAKPAFDKFNALIKLGPTYRGIDELYANPPKYDVYMAGSDQLWNPTLAYSVEPYFLTFVNQKNGVKISYATSIGISELRDNEKRDYKRWLEDFTAISVREKQAQQLLSSFVDKDIEQVADPTFLLDIAAWNHLAVKPLDAGYILLFTLSPMPELLSYARKLQHESGKQLIVVGQKEPLAADDSYTVVRDAGPREWLGYIANADLVITTSFHCTIFSLLLGAPNFYTYVASTDKRGSRIYDLLELFNLKGHLLTGVLERNYKELDAQHVNREDVIKVHCAEQERSRNYLQQQL